MGLKRSNVWHVTDEKTGKTIAEFERNTVCFKKAGMQGIIYSLDEFEAIAEAYKEWHKKSIVFGGPLLHEDS